MVALERSLSNTYQLFSFNLLECSTPSAGSSVHQNDELYITTEQSNIDEPIISKRHVHVVGGRTTQRNYRYFD